jgi:tetratricopeptide (TPR) repeat protein
LSRVWATTASLVALALSLVAQAQPRDASTHTDEPAVQPAAPVAATPSKVASAPNTLRDGFLVLPFVNTTTIKQLDWMASALPITVAEKLELLPTLRPIYGPRVLDIIDTPETEKGDGKRVPIGGVGGIRNEALVRRLYDAGARYVVAGSFSRPNWKAQISIEILEVLPPSATLPTASLHQIAAVTGVDERDAVQTLLLSLIGKLVDQAGFHPEPEAQAAIKQPVIKDLYAFALFGRAINQCFGVVGPKDPTKSLLVWKKMTLIEPKFAEGHRMLGQCELEMGDKGKAASQIAYALDLKPDYYPALMSLVRLYRHDGNRTRTLELVEKALEARPYDIEARETLGELLWESGDLDAAEIELEKVVAVAPRSLSARRTLALIYAAKGRTQDLEEELERVADIAPDDVEIRLDLASAYQRTGSLDKAIGAYEEVLKHQPKSAVAWKFIGDCYRRKGDTDKAITAYQKVMKLAPEDPRPYFLLGATYSEAGQDAKAEAVFQEAQQFRRYLGEAWINLGAIAYRRGDLSKAFWYLSRAVQRVPLKPKAHYDYALVLSAKKDRERALDELRVAADLDPEDAETRYLAGVILLRLGRLDEAKREFEEALKRRPDHVDAKYNLALLNDLDRRYGGERGGQGPR